VVLPEARDAEAQRVAQRIRETLATDQEEPPISASIGISIYQGEGERVEKLLAEADQNLYQEKERRRAISKPAEASRRRLKKG